MIISNTTPISNFLQLERFDILKYLVDDRDARTIAALHHIKLTGTLGILIQAKQRGLIDAVQPLLDRLRDEHIFWISAEMYNTVLHLSAE